MFFILLQSILFDSIFNPEQLKKSSLTILVILDQPKMKNIKFLVLILVALFSACQKNESDKIVPADYNAMNETSRLKSATIGEFSVLTYNVAGLLEPFSSSNPSENTPQISVLINDYDIVQVQEDFNYHAALYEDDYHPYRTPTSGGMGIGDGLNTMSIFPFSDDLDRVDWDDCNGTDCLTPKGLTWLRLRIDEGVYIDLYNLHTNAGTEDGDLEARRANIIQFIDYVQSHSQGNAFIITGDFNCRYTRAEDNIRLVSDDLYATDVWIQLIKEGTEPEQGSEALVCPETDILTDFSCELVDKIFYRGNNHITLTPLEFTYEDAKFRDSDGNMLSDHRPVYTKFRWTLATNLKLSDPFGGPHGTSYNDVNSIPDNPVVRTVGIRTGSRVDQVNLTLTDGTHFVHGGTGGTAHSLTLNPAEYLNSITMCSGKKDGHTRVFYIKFTTSAGRELSGGATTETSVTYTAPAGWQIVGFHGRSGSELDKCGVIYAPVL